MTSMPPPSDGVPRFRFSTETFLKRDRLAALRDIFGRTVVKLDIEPLTPDRFHCESSICALPGLALWSGLCSPARVTHPRELVDDDDLSIMIGPWKKWTASMLGRNPVLGHGDAVVMWNAEVGAMTWPSNIRFLTFRVPVGAIAPLVPDIGAAIAQRIPAQSEALDLLSRYLGLFQNAPATREVGHLAVTHVYDLLALAMGATRTAAEVAKGRGVRAARLRAFKADIIENFGRRNLSVDEVAARHRVTPRYIQMLFEGEGTTFSEFVLGQRLARAHRMLTDPRFADRSISLVAFDAGFGDLSYFNRAFRRRFGGAPSEVRAAATRGEQK